VNLEGAIIIIDEAHNIADAAEEAMSFDIKSEDLEKIELELVNLLNCIEPGYL
jgi:Rad3-related DNA helicase